MTKESLENKIKSILTEYDLNNEEIEDAVIDITERAFLITGTPKEEDLENYVAEYMDR